MNSEGQGFRGDFGFLPKSFRSMILFREQGKFGVCD